MNNYQEYIYLSYILTISTLLIYLFIIYKNYRKTLQKLEKINEAYKSLEKKCRNLTTELDLKDMQIKSQEQMISRRTQELNELKNNPNSNTPAQDNFDAEKIKLLEVIK